MEEIGHKIYVVLYESFIPSCNSLWDKMDSELCEYVFLQLQLDEFSISELTTEIEIEINELNIKKMEIDKYFSNGRNN